LQVTRKLLAVVLALSAGVATPVLAANNGNGNGNGNGGGNANGQGQGGGNGGTSAP